MPSDAATYRDKKAFTEEVAARMRAAVPQGKLSIDEDLAISLVMPDGGKIDASLERIWDYCQRNPSGCEALVTRSVSSLKDQLQPPQITRDDILPVVRTKDYIQQGMDPETFAKAVFRQITPTIWMLVMVDLPSTTRTLMSHDLGELGLSRDEAIALAAQNLDDGLPALADEIWRDSGGAYGQIESHKYYGAGRILLVDQWAELAGTMRGSLLVTVPDGGTILFADSASASAVKWLRTQTKIFMDRSDRPISDQTLVWSRDGWKDWAGRW